MVNGVHAIIYAKQPDAVRTFFRDVVGFEFVDAGRGWLIFELPAAELGVHPTEGHGSHELYLMCDNIDATIADFTSKGVACGPITDEGWGRVASVKVAESTDVGLYEPRHPSPLHLKP